MNSKSRFGIRAMLVPAALAALAAFAIAQALPGNKTFNVYSTSNTLIGTASTTSGGSHVDYTDNPNTNHPPNSNADYDLGGDGNYHDSAGYTVVITPLGQYGTYGWAKVDSNGNTVDSGRMVISPSPA